MSDISEMPVTDKYLSLLLIGLQCEYVTSGQHKSGTDAAWYDMLPLREMLQIFRGLARDWQLWLATTRLFVVSRVFQDSNIYPCSMLQRLETQALFKFSV